MLEFSEALPLLRERLERDLRAGDLTRRQLLAAVVCLLDRTLIRVGNDEYARENRSYGLTTLRRRHVKVDGATLRFSFRGKSGVEHSIAISDPRLARIVQRCHDLPGQELFQYLDAAGKRQSVSSDDVNDYLRALSGRDITAKDFRTWGGTMLAAVELRRMGPAASRREADRNIVAAVDAVAERLGNTRAVCRKYYVHPALLRAYLMGRVAPLAPRARRGRHRGTGAALRRDEVVVLQFLQEVI
jgi:DNA topoisomerase-1